MRIYAKIHKLIDIKKEMGKKEVCLTPSLPAPLGVGIFHLPAS